MNEENQINPGQGSGMTGTPSMTDHLAGEAGNFVEKLAPYLPQELVGGSVPHVAGKEDEAIWNAASQACGTEKVYYTYTIEENRCWYLACPASSLASNPDSWCPLAAALPGNSEYWDRETVYIYEHEGFASALRWDSETGRMQVFLGAGRTLLPRIQSMDANFVTVNPDVADQVRWKNKSLMTEKLSRATGRMLLISGILANIGIAAILLFDFLSVNFMARDLASVKKKTEKISTDIINEAYNAFQSDSVKHMLRVQELLDELNQIDGTLVKYEVEGGKLTWEALVPKSYQQGSGTIRGKVQQKIEKDGRVRLVGSR